MVALDALDVSDRLRAIDPEAVDRLVVSMGDTLVGQLTPIQVTHVAGRYLLVAGAHRVAAAQKLGWDRIAASVVDGNPDQLRLHEIEENLSRQGLSAYDETAFLHEWVEVCRRLGVVPKHGGARRRGDQSPDPGLRSYSDEIAKKFKLSRSKLFVALRRRRSIDDVAWDLIAGTAIANKGAYLDALCDVPREKQLRVVEGFLAPLDPGAKRAPFAAFCNEAAGSKPAKTPSAHAGHRALLAAWDAANSQARALFLTKRREEVTAAQLSIDNNDGADA